MASNFLKKINNLKSYTKVSDLEINQEYKIIDAEKVETKYGKTIKVILEDGEKLYLPKRFSIIKKSELKYFKNTIIIYKGKNQKKMDILEFKKVDESEENKKVKEEDSDDEVEEKIVISDSDSDL